jgi:hypothetical protein
MHRKSVNYDAPGTYKSSLKTHKTCILKNPNHVSAALKDGKPKKRSNKFNSHICGGASSVSEDLCPSKNLYIHAADK